MIAIVEGCGSNIASLQFALERLGYESVLTNDPARIEAASAVILPGVGSANAAMANLRASGLDQLIPRLTQPVLGICLGMQILYDFSEEGDTNCLGIIPGRVKEFSPDCGLPLPHMGWNQLQGLMESQYVYFVHGFYAPLSMHTLASARYGIELSAIVQCRNFWGMQFHPEKSGAAGAKCLAEFLRGSII